MDIKQKIKIERVHEGKRRFQLANRAECEGNRRKAIATNDQFKNELLRIIKNNQTRTICKLFWQEHYRYESLVWKNMSIQEVALKVNSKSNNSSHDDTSRKELLWENREENIIEEWRQRCLVRSEAHGVKGKIMKRRYTYCSIPSILIPVVTSGLSTILQPYPLASSH